MQQKLLKRETAHAEVMRTDYETCVNLFNSSSISLFHLLTFSTASICSFFNKCAENPANSFRSVVRFNQLQ